MDARIARITKHLKKLSPEGTARRIVKSCRKEIGLPSTQGRSLLYIRCLMGKMDEELDEKTRKQIMESCGRQCISKSTIDKAKRLKARSRSLDEFLDLLNRNHIGGGRLETKGQVISGGYDRCYCGAVSRSKQPISLTYCSCSAGWYRELFERTLEKPVEVEALGSIIHGSPKCLFNIHI